MKCYRFAANNTLNILSVQLMKASTQDISFNKPKEIGLQSL